MDATSFRRSSASGWCWRIAVVIIAVAVAGCGDGGSEDLEDVSPTPEELPPALRLPEQTLPSGREDDSYEAILEVQGGVAPYQFDVLSGSIPDGLRLDRSAGELFGAPSQAGTYTFEIRVKDDVEQSATRDYQISIDTWFTAVRLECGESHTATLTRSAVDGDGVYLFNSEEAVTFFELVLPSQDTTLITLAASSPDGDPAIFVGRRGEPVGSELVTYYYMTSIHPGDEELRIHDESVRTISYYLSYGANISMVVAATEPGEVTLDMTCHSGAVLATPYLPNASVGQPYSQQLEAISGTPPYTFSAVGALPPGLELLEDGTVSGVVDSAGTYSVDVTIMDADGTGEQRALQLWTPEILEILCSPDEPTETTALEFQTWAFDGQQGLATVGGARFVTLMWPTGVSRMTFEISGDGTGYTLGLFQAIPGTPPGSSLLDDYVHTAFDSPGDDPDPVFLELSHELMPRISEYEGRVSLALGAEDGSGAGSLEVSCSSELAVSSFSGPNGEAGQVYEKVLEASGGDGTYEWTTTSTLPQGLELSPEGTLAGTPTSAGAYSATFIVSDGKGVTVSRDVYIGIGEAGTHEGCGVADWTTCDEFSSGKLTASAWVDRVDADFSIPGSTLFYCVDVPEDATGVTVRVDNSTGDADLFVGYPDIAPGDPNVSGYWYFATFEGDDEIILDGSSYPELERHGGQLSVAVPAYEPGQFLLSIECDYE